jgi:hypothetical protein
MTHVEANAVVPKAQRFISNFKSVSGVLVEMLSGCPNIFIFTVLLDNPTQWL